MTGGSRAGAAGRRVVVAMSGGVDSSVTAALLLEQGYEVLGATLRFWLCDEGGGEAKSCCGLDAVAEARDTAGRLGFHHHVIDCRTRFEEQVLRPCWEEYNRGRTPNPCVLCNPHIKLLELLRQARALGAELVATGHHARVIVGDRPALLRGRDRNKDQSYFLFGLHEQQLASLLMPVGEMTKDEVRQRARDLGLGNAERHESQDACLGSADEPFAEALRRRFDAEARPGDLVDTEGNVLGRHRGIHLYTIGQRRGLGVALGQRAYVVGIREQSREVVVSTDPQDLCASGLTASGVRWLVPPGEDRFQARVQIRYRHRACPATVELAPGETVRVRFVEPQRAVTPGQAAVFYKEERVLGGGWILTVE